MPKMILRYGDMAPKLAADVYVHASAHVIGDVEIGPASSVWFQVVIRADVERVRVGRATNIQDHATIHVSNERWPTILGDGVTIGHRAVLHGCSVGDYALIGIGAIVLDGAEVGSEALVGAGALVAPGAKIPPRTLVLGSPAKPVRNLRPEEIEHLHRSAERYVGYAKSYRDQGL
jgi:carbonic anhydrase/acetyltransferase-like protein (isoleucine patch superfamily)